jgi:hypothetical protein
VQSTHSKPSEPKRGFVFDNPHSLHWILTLEQLQTWGMIYRLVSGVGMPVMSVGRFPVFSSKRAALSFLRHVNPCTTPHGGQYSSNETLDMLKDNIYKKFIFVRFIINKNGLFLNKK